MRLGEAGYRAMAVDLRGHGDSSWDDQGNYGHDSFLEGLLSVVAHCGLEKPVLIGASLGGAAWNKGQPRGKTATIVSIIGVIVCLVVR